MDSSDVNAFVRIMYFLDEMVSSLILGKWMRSEIVGSSEEKPTVNEVVGGFSVFFATRISHCICASQVSSYVMRPVPWLYSLENIPTTLLYFQCFFCNFTGGSSSFFFDSFELWCFNPGTLRWDYDYIWILFHCYYCFLQ
jgi:hypothetical protein